jgi:hypothetical protein
LAQRNAELESRQAEVDASRKALDDERLAWETQRAEAQQELTQRNAELETRQADVDASRKALDDERLAWETQRAEVELNLEQRTHQLDARERQRETTQSATTPEEDPRLEADDEGPEETSSDWEGDTEHAEASSAAPVNAQEILHQLGHTPASLDDTNSVVLSPVPPRQGQTETPPEGEDEEESIDDYMAKLLQRVRGGGEPVPTAATMPAKPVEESKLPVEIPYPRPATGKERESVKLSPRAVAPETVADLSAMRELANFSAQHAIDRSHRQVLGRTAPTKLLLTLLALTATGLLLWKWTDLGDTTLVLGAMVTLVTALVWGVRTLKLAGRMFRRRPARLPRRDKGKEK